MGLLASFLSACSLPLPLLPLLPLLLELEPDTDFWLELVGLLGLVPCALRPNRRGTDSEGHALTLLLSLSLPLPEADEEEEEAARPLKGEGKRFTTFCFVGRAAALLEGCSLGGAAEEVGIGFAGVVGFSWGVGVKGGRPRLLLLLLRRARRRSSAAHNPLPLPVTRLYPAPAAKTSSAMPAALDAMPDRRFNNPLRLPPRLEGGLCQL